MKVSYVNSPQARTSLEEKRFRELIKMLSASGLVFGRTVIRVK